MLHELLKWFLLIQELKRLYPIQEQNVPLNPGMFRSPSRPCRSGGSFLKLSVSSAHSFWSPLVANSDRPSAYPDHLLFPSHVARTVPSGFPEICKRLHQPARTACSASSQS
uniref:Uncharacterized protein n=1 Tax=Micrurus corallinus TaxID=54390 RepID=A0A2D4FYA5_MICCO